MTVIENILRNVRTTAPATLTARTVALVRHLMRSATIIALIIFQSRIQTASNKEIMEMFQISAETSAQIWVTSAPSGVLEIKSASQNVALIRSNVSINVPVTQNVQMDVPALTGAVIPTNQQLLKNVHLYGARKQKNAPMIARMSEINVLVDAKVIESAKTVVTMIISTNVLITVLAILTVRMAVLVTIIMGNSIARIILQAQVLTVSSNTVKLKKIVETIVRINQSTV